MDEKELEKMKKEIAAQVRRDMEQEKDNQYVFRTTVESIIKDTYGDRCEGKWFYTVRDGISNLARWVFGVRYTKMIHVRHRVVLRELTQDLLAACEKARKKFMDMGSGME